MKIIDIALKDLTRSMRSAFTIGMAVVAPLLITGLMYFAFGGMAGGSADLPAVKVGVYNADQLPSGSPLDAPLGENIRSMFFDDSVKSWITASDYADEAAARDAVDRQEVGVAILIPAAFTADFLAGQRGTPVTLVQDPTLTITPLIVRNMVTAFVDGVAGGGVAIQTILEQQAENNLAVEPEQVPILMEQYQTWYANFQRELFHSPERAALVLNAPAGDSAQTAGSMADVLGMVMAGQMIFFAFFTGAFAMMSILQEQEEGTLARLFTTPTERTLVLAGKFLAVFLTVCLQGLVLMTAARFAFKVDWGEPGAATLALAGQVVAASGLGVLLIAFVKNTKQGGPVLGGALTGLSMLGGLFTVAIPSAPAIFNTLAVFTPQGWVLKAWRAVLSGQSAGDVLVPFAVCLALGAAMFVTGAALFRRRFA
jgi:ABC-2 type transport system permease protein